MIAKTIMPILDAHMAYSDIGNGDPIVLLHGNPMHGFLWHALVPYIQSLGRLIIPDLIGMGDSARLPGNDPDRYSFANHRRYLDALLDRLGIVDKVTMVCHDWGGALGFDWANRHRSAIKGLVYSETHVNCENVGRDPERADFIRWLRTPAAEDSILQGDLLLDWFMGPNGFVNPLIEANKAEILRPWTKHGENRRASLEWIRQAPVDAEPAMLCAVIENYQAWLQESPVPKLLIVATAGFMGDKELADCRTWPNQTEVSVPGAHFLQMEFPQEFGKAMSDWYHTL